MVTINKWKLNIDFIFSSKINSKWIIDITVKHKTIYLLKNNTEENVCNLGHADGFYLQTQRHYP